MQLTIDIDEEVLSSGRVTGFHRRGRLLKFLERIQGPVFFEAQWVEDHLPQAPFFAVLLEGDGNLMVRGIDELQLRRGDRVELHLDGGRFYSQNTPYALLVDGNALFVQMLADCAQPTSLRMKILGVLPEDLFPVHRPTKDDLHHFRERWKVCRRTIEDEILVYHRCVIQPLVGLRALEKRWELQFRFVVDDDPGDGALPIGDSREEREGPAGLTSRRGGLAALADARLSEGLADLFASAQEVFGREGMTTSLEEVQTRLFPSTDYLEKGFDDDRK